MHLRRELGHRPWDPELSTLQEYQWRDGNRTLWRSGRRCRGGGLDGSQLGMRDCGVRATSATAICALLLACTGRSDRHSGKKRIGELELRWVGRLEHHDVLFFRRGRRVGFVRVPLAKICSTPVHLYPVCARDPTTSTTTASTTASSATRNADTNTDVGRCSTSPARCWPSSRRLKRLVGPPGGMKELAVLPVAFIWTATSFMRRPPPRCIRER